MARVVSAKAMHTILSNLPGMHDGIGFAARLVHKNAEARLAMHRRQHNAKVTLTEGKLDWFINLVDPAALSIEFGHWAKTRDKNTGKKIQLTRKDGSPVYVEGLYILTRAAGLA